MAYNVVLTEEAQKDLARLSPDQRQRIAKKINRVRALADPRAIDHGLTGEWAGYWSYRTGDLRIICSIKDDVLTITAVKIGHRREIYRS